MTSTDIYTIPYTYLITHTPTNKKYYGVRFAKGCSPSDLWLTYFTSSKYVNQLIEEYGKESFKTQIRKIFTNVETARCWENKVLKRMAVTNRDDYLNKTNNLSRPPMYGLDNASSKLEVREKISKSLLKYYETNVSVRRGTYMSEEQKKLISISRRSRPPASAETNAKISATLKGRPALNKGTTHTDEAKAKISAAGKGRKKSEEHKAKISASHKGKIKTPEHLAKISDAKKANLLAKTIKEELENEDRKLGEGIL